MLDVIFTIKFIHMMATAVMFGTWVCIALFMLLAYGSDSTSVVAVTSFFVVRAERMLMIPAVVLQPLAGFPLAIAIGAAIHEYWIVVSVAIYACVVVSWLASFVVEMRIRKLAKGATLMSSPLPDTYRRLFRVWGTATCAGLAGMIAIMALMIWQPKWS